MFIMIVLDLESIHRGYEMDVVYIINTLLPV